MKKIDNEEYKNNNLIKDIINSEKKPNFNDDINRLKRIERRIKIGKMMRCNHIFIKIKSNGECDFDYGYYCPKCGLSNLYHNEFSNDSIIYFDSNNQRDYILDGIYDKNEIDKLYSSLIKNDDEYVKKLIK